MYSTMTFLVNLNQNEHFTDIFCGKKYKTAGAQTCVFLKWQFKGRDEMDRKLSR